MNSPDSDAALDAAHPYRAVAAWAARALGAPAPAGEGQGTLEVSDPQRAIFALDFLLNEPMLAVRRALAEALNGARTADEVAQVILSFPDWPAPQVTLALLDPVRASLRLLRLRGGAPRLAATLPEIGRAHV